MRVGAPRSRALLAGLLLLGLIVRLAVVFEASDLRARIADERDYVQLATSLVEGRGFAWSSGHVTSLRPPLYPALVAGIWTVTGPGAFTVIRLAQVLLSALTAWLTFVLGRRVFDDTVGRWAAVLVWLYPTLIFLNVPLLTETLFTVLVLAFALCLVALVQRPRLATALACGVVLGLSALTRSVTWPIPIVLCPALLVVLAGPFRLRAQCSAALLVAFAVTVGPWAVRNTQLQGVVTIVDTMGGLNLRMGNYEYTPEHRMWDAVSLTGERSWVHALTLERVGGPDGITEGEKDKWAQRKAVEYMAGHPGQTIRRSMIKFGDFWGLERSFIAGVQQGLFTPPRWFAVLAGVLILASSAVVMLGGLAGAWLARRTWRVDLAMLLPIVALTGAHSLAFGHSRYHVPLVPILAIYAVALVREWRRSGWPAADWRTAGAAVSVLVVVAGWLYRLIVLDSARIAAWLGR